MNMTRPTLLILAAAALIGTAGTAKAGFEIVLKDGVTIAADTVRRYGDTYQVRSWSGERMSVHASDIQQIRASEDPPTASGGGDEPGPVNRVRSSPEAGGAASPREEPPTAPPPPRAESPRVEVDPHMRPRPAPGSGGGGQVLSGPDISLPTKEEELEVLGAPSEWSKPSIDPSWKPQDAFDH